MSVTEDLAVYRETIGVEWEGPACHATLSVVEGGKLKRTWRCFHFHRTSQAARTCGYNQRKRACAALESR